MYKEFNPYFVKAVNYSILFISMWQGQCMTSLGS